MRRERMASAPRGRGFPHKMPEMRSFGHVTENQFREIGKSGHQDRRDRRRIDMTLTGKLIKDANPLRMATVTSETHAEDFHKCLEDSFLLLCKELGIPIPLWLKKNTREFGRFHKTFFPRDQFLEPMIFDRFELILDHM